MIRRASRCSRSTCLIRRSATYRGQEDGKPRDWYEIKITSSRTPIRARQYTNLFGAPLLRFIEDEITIINDKNLQNDLDSAVRCDWKRLCPSFSTSSGGRLTSARFRDIPINANCYQFVRKTPSEDFGTLRGIPHSPGDESEIDARYP